MLQRSFNVFMVMLRFFRSASKVPVLTPYSLISVYLDIFFRFSVSHNGSNVIIPTPASHLAYPKMLFLNNAEFSAIMVIQKGVSGMPDCKEMYLHLMRETEAASRILVKAQ